jgi:hypothetical protein
LFRLWAGLGKALHVITCARTWSDHNLNVPDINARDYVVYRTKSARDAWVVHQHITAVEISGRSCRVMRDSFALADLAAQHPAGALKVAERSVYLCSGDVVDFW